MRIAEIRFMTAPRFGDILKPLACFSLFLVFLISHMAPAAAVKGGSRCIALADAGYKVIRASFTPAQSTVGDVKITYLGHSSFLIQTPKGIDIVTDYTGYSGAVEVPDVVTMNHAHGSHYTDNPDPRIPHIMRGWKTGGGQAEHNIEVEDVRIRNVPTDITNWAGEREIFGNSIFIFEVAGLCIGHLGHLHHDLTLEHMGLIGNLDVVLVPVRMRHMQHQDIIDVVKKLRPRLAIPMHYFDSWTLGSFLELAKPDFEVAIDESTSITVNVANLPKKMTFHVLPGS